MLSELAIVPDVFDSASYSNAETCNLHLNYLKEPILNEVLVRDLREGGWGAFVTKDPGRWHPKAKELLKQIGKGARLRVFRPMLQLPPDTYVDWCREAVMSHEVEPLAGVIAGNDIAAGYPADSIVCSIDKLTSRPWWQSRGPSVRVQRNTAAYLCRLRLVLENANSLMFIDPYVDAEKPNYSQFLELLVAGRRATSPPLIEIHREHYVEGRDISGRPIYPLPAEIEKRFRNSWGPKLGAAGLSAEIFVWDHVHDRYLITNLIGVLVPYGFDISKNPAEETTWARLTRKDRDDIQREYDPAAKRHQLICKFRIP